MRMLGVRAIVAVLTAAQVGSNAVPADGDVVVGPPPYLPDPVLGPLGKPRGASFNFSLATARSKFYNGSDPTFVGTECYGPTPAECCHKQPPVAGRCAINAQRSVNVYVPAAYVDGDAVYVDHKARESSTYVPCRLALA